VVNGASYGTGAIYQWYNGDNLLHNATEAHYSATASGVYRVVVAEATCQSTSDTIRVTIVGNGGNSVTPVIAVTPGATICGPDGSVMLSLANESDYNGAALTYFWYHNGVYSGGMSHYSALGSLGAGTYSLYVKANNCGAYDTAVVVVSYEAISTIAIPVVGVGNGGVACETDGSVALYVSNISAYGTPAYQWYLGDEPINGATRSSYEARIAGHYKVVITDGQCQTTSDTIAVTIQSGGTATIPLINTGVTPPNIPTICGEDGAIILSLLNGSDFPNGITEYLWLHDGDSVGSEPTYIAVGTNAKGPYQLYVSDGTCGAYSPIVVLLSDPGVSIVKPEIIATNNGTACAPGSVALFLTNWDVYTNPTYQWYKDGDEISGATTSHYAATETGRYKVVVREGACWSVSDIVHVTVYTGGAPAIVPVIASDPSNQIICGENGGVILSLGNAAAYGNATLSFWWIYENNLIPGANGPTYSVHGQTGAGVYQLYVSNGTCGEYSQKITITYDSTTNIVKPQLVASNNGVACATPGNVILSVENWRDYPDSVTYRWYRNDTLLSAVSPTSGYYIAMQSGIYKVVVVTGGDCNAVSDNKVVTINNSGTATIPTILSEPSAPVLCGVNGAVILKLRNASAYSNITEYYWLLNNERVVGREPTYAATEAGTYYLYVSDGNCGAVSAGLVVYMGAGSIAQPVVVASNNGIVCETNGSVLLYLTNWSDFNGARYQWTRNGVNIPGAIESYYLATAIDTINYTYRLIITEGSCIAVSNEEQVTIQTGSASTITPIIVADPTRICGTTGAAILYLGNRSAYTDSITQYVWTYKQGFLPGDGIVVGNEPTFAATAPGIYTLFVSAGACGATSSSITVDMNWNSTIVKPEIVATNNRVACATDGSVAIYVKNWDAYTGATYQWYRSGSSITGATQANYAATATDIYKVVVTEGSCKTVSDTVSVHIETGGTATIPTIEGTDATGTPSTSICGDDGVINLFENSGRFDSTATYTWFRNGAVIRDSTSASCHTKQGRDGAGTYYLHVVYNGCAAYSVPIEVVFRQDSVKPSLTCVDTIFQSTDLGRCDVTLDNIYRDSAIVAVDDCLSALRVEWTNNGRDWSTDADSLLRHPFEKGQSTLTYKVIDVSGNDSTCVVIVVVEDREAPKFDTIPPSITVSCVADSALIPDSTQIILAAAVSDNCSPSDSLRITYSDAISDSTCLSRYTITRTWTVTDLDGNYSDTTQTIKIEDNIGPIAITAEGALDTAISCNNVGDTIIPMGWIPEFADNCGYPVRIELRVDDRIEISSTEITRVRHWVAIDTCGNESDPYIQTISFCGYYIDLTLTAVTPIYSNTDTAFIPESEFIEKRIDFDGWDLYLIDNTFTYIIAPENLGNMAAEKVLIEMTFEPDAQRIISTTGTISTNTVSWTVYNVGPYSVGLPVDVRIQALKPGLYANTFTIRLDTTETVRREPIVFLDNNTVIVKVLQELWEIPNVIVSTDNHNNALRIKELLNDDIASAELIVYNRWGNQVYRNNHYEAAMTADDVSRLFTGQNLAKGTYFYDLTVRFKEVVLPNGERRTRPIIKRQAWIAILQ
jgi:hypothetical protein